MRDPITADQLAALYDGARRLPPDQALRLLGTLCTGRPAYLALGGFAIHASGAEIADPGQPEAPVTVLAALDDQTLHVWGLHFSQVTPPADPHAGLPQLRPAVIALRLGLLLHCLDMAFLHLEGRESFGQKLLHHQLMKALFANINAEAQRMLDELRLPRAWADAAALQAMQQAISHQFRHAAKLMGGHGFLEGRCHALEFLSTLLAAMVAPQAEAPARRAGGGNA